MYLIIFLDSKGKELLKSATELACVFSLAYSGWTSTGQSEKLKNSSTRRKKTKKLLNLDKTENKKICVKSKNMIALLA